jgi:hypothetical protein
MDEWVYTAIVEEEENATKGIMVEKKNENVYVYD